MKNKNNTIAFVSIKGGVGKTTLALEIAASLVNNFGKRVLLVDANFSSPNIGLYLDLTNEKTLHDALSGTKLHNVIYESYGIDVIPASMYYDDPIDIFQLKKILSKFKSRYDYVIIDSSPNYEELKPVIEAADKIFLVTSPDIVTLTTTLKAAKAAKEQKTPIDGIIINRIRSPRHEFNLKEIENLSGIPVVGKIKDHKKMAQALKEKKPIVILDYSNPISKEIKNISSAICGEPEKVSILSRIIPNDFIHKEKVNREVMRKTFYESQF